MQILLDCPWTRMNTTVRNHLERRNHRSIHQRTAEGSESQEVNLRASREAGQRASLEVKREVRHGVKQEQLHAIPVVLLVVNQRPSRGTPKRVQAPPKKANLLAADLEL